MRPATGRGSKRPVPSFREYAQLLINELRREGRYSTADKYVSSLSSVEKYLKTEQLPDISLDEVDAQLVYGYNVWMRSNSLVMNTISYYNRVFRSIYNKASRQFGFVNLHPFEEVYTGVAATRKRAASGREIARVITSDTGCDPQLTLARDLFAFSYFTRGMAFVDMAYLRKSDIKGHYLFYCRHKTGAAMQVKLEPEAEGIISKYSSQTCASRYVFPIIGQAEGMQAYRKYRNALAINNRCLKTFQRNLPMVLTYYVSRHSWASNAHSMDIPVGVISESLGHSSKRTTSIYLSHLNTSRLDQANHKVMGRLKKMMGER